MENKPLFLNEDLRVWFGDKKKPKGSSQPKGPWVNICRKDANGKHPPCGRESDEKGAYPKCKAAGVAGKMSDAEKKSACSTKRKAEKKNPKPGTGNKPTMVSNESIRKVIHKFLNEDRKIIENIFGGGYKVYFKNDTIRWEIVYTYDEAVKLKKEIEDETNDELGIINLEKESQDMYNENIKNEGGNFDINTKWNYTGTVFLENKFKDKDGELYFIERKKTDNGLEVNVFNRRYNKIAFSEFKYDMSGNLRNNMYVSVSPAYQNKGIAKAMYDYVVLNNYTLKPALSGLLDDGIKLWNSNAKYK
jgi:hypothetical protein